MIKYNYLLLLIIIFYAIFIYCNKFSNYKNFDNEIIQNAKKKILQYSKNSYFKLRTKLCFSDFCFISLCAIISFIIFKQFSEIKKYPKGPVPLPFIGNLLQIDTANPQKSIVKWQKKYGNIFTIWLPKPVVVVAEWKELQNLLLGSLGEHCLNRPKSYIYGIFTQHLPDGDGIVLCSGEKWRVQRRFALNAFKSFGMGGNRMEIQTNFYKDALLHQLISFEKDKMFPSSDAYVIDNIHSQLAFCFGNIIHHLIMGRHYEYDDPEFLRFKNHIDKTLEGVVNVQMLIIDCYPWTRFFFPRYYQYISDGYALQKFFLEEIEKHAANLNVNSKPTNIIDAYLHEMYYSDDSHLSKLTLAIIAGDLWTGGLETIVTTLTWSIIYLIHYPRVQNCLHDELDAQLGNEPFKMSDRQRLPYLRATIDELQRIVNVLPWHIPHATDVDIKLNNCILPRGTTIMPQFGAVHFNETYFNNPYQFCPERFLKKEILEEDCGKLGIKKEEKWIYVGSKNLAPFGLGKRACLGEGLARMELFIVFAALLQNFFFEAVDSENMPSLKRSPGMTSKPQLFKCRIFKRHKKLITSFNSS